MKVATIWQKGHPMWLPKVNIKFHMQGYFICRVVCNDICILFLLLQIRFNTIFISIIVLQKYPIFLVIYNFFQIC